MQTYKSNSVADTKKIAKKIAKKFKNGEVLGLVGNLGSGKTHFTKGIAEFFKIKKTITSPTFVLLKPYQIKNDKQTKQLVHIDCYRLDSPEELLAIGLNEFIKDKKNIVVIEWAEKIKNILPKNTIYIDFKLGKKDSERIIKIR
ncbi:MAG: tRNA (adenosine(37)-N6)-threonylcarbamoyltransferase complex ATPase subunit type 1 TsaE [Patescibacteria group bacterium]